MTSRIGGDWNTDALEAFRLAYGQQMMTPQDQDITPSGLPGNNISNVSPWYEQLGILWKYPSGKGPDDDLQKPFNPDAFITQEDESEGLISESDIDDYIDSLTPDELLSLAEELGVDFEGDYDQETMSDEEIDNLISELNDD